MRRIEALEKHSIRELRRAYQLVREYGGNVLIFTGETPQEHIEAIARACREQEARYIAITDLWDYEVEDEAQKFRKAGFVDDGWMNVCYEITEDGPVNRMAWMMHID